MQNVGVYVLRSLLILGESRVTINTDQCKTEINQICSNHFCGKTEIWFTASSVAVMESRHYLVKQAAKACSTWHVKLKVLGTGKSEIVNPKLNVTFTSTLTLSRAVFFKKKLYSMGEYPLG